MNKRTELYRQFIQEFKNSGKTEISFAENEVPLVLTLQYLSQRPYYGGYLVYLSTNASLFETYLDSITLTNYNDEFIIRFVAKNLSDDDIIVSGLDFSEQELEYFIQKLK